MTLTLLEIILSDDKIVIVIILVPTFAPIHLSQVLSQLEYFIIHMLT